MLQRMFTPILKSHQQRQLNVSTEHPLLWGDLCTPVTDTPPSFLDVLHHHFEVRRQDANIGDNDNDGRKSDHHNAHDPYGDVRRVFVGFLDPYGGHHLIGLRRWFFVLWHEDRHFLPSRCGAIQNSVFITCYIITNTECVVLFYNKIKTTKYNMFTKRRKQEQCKFSQL